MQTKRTESKRTRCAIARARQRRQERKLKGVSIDYDAAVESLSGLYNRIDYPRNVWRPVWICR